MSRLRIQLGIREWRFHETDAALWMILSRQWHRTHKKQHHLSLPEVVALRRQIGVPANDTAYGSTVPDLFAKVLP